MCGDCLCCFSEISCFWSISAHLPRGCDPSGRVHGEAADVVGVVEVEPLPVVFGVVAHAGPARVVHHLFAVQSMLNGNRCQMTCWVHLQRENVCFSRGNGQGCVQYLACNPRRCSREANKAQRLQVLVVLFSI